MPALIPILAGAAGASAFVVTVLTVATTVATGLYARNKAKQAERKARDAYNASLQDRLLTIRSAVAERSYVLGTCRTGGALLYSETTGLNKTALDSIVALACNKCELVGYYIGDEYIAVHDFPGDHYGKQQEIDAREDFVITSASGSVNLSARPKAGTAITAVVRAGKGLTNTVTVSLGAGTTLNYSGAPIPPSPRELRIFYKIDGSTRVRAIFKDGDPDQSSTEWIDHTTPQWTENHRLRGVCHLRTLMLWDEDLFAPGAPVIGGVLRGGWIWTGEGGQFHKFFDPRDGSYPAYTDNPAILTGWWMTLARNRGGCGIPSDWIDWVSIAIAANICDELITVRKIDGSGYEQVKRYQCHTVLSTATPPLENLDIILSAMNGQRARTAGKYRIVAGAFRTATLTITDKDIAGKKPIGTVPTGGNDAPPNIVTARFADRTKNWQYTSPQTVKNDDYIDLDEHEEPTDINLPATTDPRQANYLQGIILEGSRPADTVTLTVGGIGEDIALLDVVALSIANRPAYDGKTYEVNGIIDFWNGEFELTLTEIRPQIWALDPDKFTPVNPAPQADLSYLWNVPPLTNFTVDAGEPQTLPDGNSVTLCTLTWDQAASSYVHEAGRIELRYREAGGDWIGIPSVPGDSAGTTLSASLSDGDKYQFQARAVNGIGASSRWTDYWLDVAGTPLANGVQGPGLFTWAGGSGVETTSSSITKTAATTAWDSGAYSLQSYSNGCFASCRAGEANTYKFIALNGDPATDQNYLGLDFAILFRDNGDLAIFESGVDFGSIGPYTPSTVVAITYDGESIRYLKDGTVVRTVPGQAGRRFFLDTSLYTPGASLLDVAFGPMGGVGAPGAAGPAAQAIRLSSTSQAFVFPSSGAATPPSITFTATRQNIPAATVWSTTPSVALSGSGDSRILTDGVFQLSGATAIKVRAEAAGFYDEITVVKLQNGAAGANGQPVIQGILQNEAHTLAADPDGVVSDYSAASGQFWVFEGTTDRTSLATFSIAAASNCTVQINTAANTPITGQPKGFYRVTAVSADQAYADLQFSYGAVTSTKRFTVIRARQGVPGDGANLLRVDDWIVGTTGSQGSPVRWSREGTAPESAIVLGGAGTAPLGPLGITEPLWECRPDGAVDGDGGWNYSNIPADASKSYRSVVWFRLNQLSGNFYHGCGFSETYDLGGGANGNPYFMGVALLGGPGGLEANQWYLSVGIVHGSGYGGGYSGWAGIWDPRTGKKILTGTEYRMAPGATTQVHRAYHFYDSTASTRQWLARPRFEEINGNEPSIYDLMGIRLPTPWIERGNCFAGANSFYKVGGVNSWGDSDVYSVTSYTTCHLQFKANTGYNRMCGLNRDPVSDPSYSSLDFAWYPHAGGIQIYESGVHIGDYGTYTAATEFAITYDGANVRYYLDRALKRTVAIVGARFFLDSSFYTPGSAIDSVKWGPGVEFETIGTADLVANAATDVIQVLPVPGQINYTQNLDNGAYGVSSNGAGSATYTNNTASVVTVECSYKASFFIDSSELSGFRRFGRLVVGTSGGYVEEDLDSGYFSDRVYPAKLSRSGSISVILAPGQYVQAIVYVTSSIQPGFYPALPPSKYSDVAIRLTVIKR